jgi:hypothetical protein
MLRRAPVFSKRVWVHAQVLMMGALLAPGGLGYKVETRACQNMYQGGRPAHYD